MKKETRYANYISILTNNTLELNNIIIRNNKCENIKCINFYYF